MRRFPLTAAALAILLLGATTAGAQDFAAGDITVIQPWARASAGKARNGAAYMTIRNGGPGADRLIAAAAEVSAKAGLHAHVQEDGIMKMRPVGGIEVSAGQTAALRPGGFHIMLMGLTAPLKEGQTFPMTLTFERAGTLTVDVRVMGVGAKGPGAAKADDRAKHAPARTIDIVIQDGRAAAGKRTIRVTEGERVALRWTTDKAVDLHLHGYDVELRVEPGRPASMTFDATVAGRFPVGVHGAGGHGNIVYVEVHPR